VTQKDSAEKAVRDIRRKTRRKLSAKEKIRIVLEGLRGEEGIASLCRREGIAENSHAATTATLTKRPLEPTVPPHWLLKGPIPLWWLQRACSCGSKALHLGIYLWFRVSCGESPVRASPHRARAYEIGSRQTLYRAIEALGAQLITVHRHPGRAARVEIIREPDTFASVDDAECSKSLAYGERE
jgi:hypothetical protein